MVVLRAVCQVVFVVVFLGVSSNAYAQTPQIETYKKKVKATLNEAVKHVAQKSFAKALVLYTPLLEDLKRKHKRTKFPQFKEWLQDQIPRVLLFMGYVYELTKQYKQAITHLRMAALYKPEPKIAKAIRVGVKRLWPKASALVEIATLPDGASIHITDHKGVVVKGTTAFKKRLLEGALTITISKEGYETRRVKLILTAGQPSSKFYKLQRAKAPLKRREVPVRQAPPPKEQRKRSVPVLGWVFAVSGAVALVAGGLMFGIAKQQFDAAEDPNRTPPLGPADIVTEKKGAQSLQTASLFVLGGGLILGGISAWAFVAHAQPKRQPKTSNLPLPPKRSTHALLTLE